jgi:uncharacterized membrane protein
MTNKPRGNKIQFSIYYIQSQNVPNSLNKINIYNQYLNSLLSSRPKYAFSCIIILINNREDRDTVAYSVFLLFSYRTFSKVIYRNVIALASYLIPNGMMVIPLPVRTT